MRGNDRKRWRASIVSALIAGFSLALHDQVRGQYLTVYGGPTYVAGVGGFQTTNSVEGSIIIVPSPSSSMASGRMTKFSATGTNLHLQSVSWDSTGSTFNPLSLGTEPSGAANTDLEQFNAGGVGVGWSELYGSGTYLGQSAVRWDLPGAIPTQLGSLGHDPQGVVFSEARGINTGGTIVGASAIYDGAGHNLGNRAVRWDPSSTTPIELGSLVTNSGTFSEADAVNDSGVVVGSSDIQGGIASVNEAVRWNPSSTVPIQLDGLGTSASTGLPSSSAQAINSAGVIIGKAEKFDASGADKGARAVRWAASGTAVTELGNLGTDSTGFTSTTAGSINERGDIAGQAEKYDASGNYLGIHAVRWEAGQTTPIELAYLGTSAAGTTLAAGTQVNDFGIEVGFANKYDASGALLDRAATMWNPDGSIVDLNTLIDPNSGWYLREALAINDGDWVAGWGTFDPDGAGPLPPVIRMFLIQVPEPASAAVLIATIAGFGLKRNRTRHV